jgi:hypothetical protein
MLKVEMGRLRFELTVDRYVLLYMLGAGTAIISAVSNVGL